jgi:hypothetical protein
VLSPLSLSAWQGFVNTHSKAVSTQLYYTQKRVRNNRDLYDLYKEDIITFIKHERLRWAGHIIRMEADRPAKRLLIQEVQGEEEDQRSDRRTEWMMIVRPSKYGTGRVLL